MTRYAYVLCVEPGSLEYKAALAIISLRENWGDWASYPLYAYSPRPGRKPSGWLREIYRRYDVTPVEHDLNTEFADYPLANKPIAMRHAEAASDAEFLVFLDSDILCWRPPTAFELPDDKDLALCVDGTKTVASAGPGDIYEPMWRRLYALTGAEDPPWTVTQLSHERVRSWWISSIVVARRSAGLMARWDETLRQAIAADIFHPDAIYLREQMALCGVAAAAGERIADLSFSHNYPIQEHAGLRRRGLAPEDAALWHYQPFFNRFFAGFARRLDAAGGTDAKIALAQAEIARLRTAYARLIGLDETLLQKWRRELRLGPRLRRMFGVSKESDRSVF